jgi:hypothetical protein
LYFPNKLSKVSSTPSSKTIGFLQFFPKLNYFSTISIGIVLLEIVIAASIIDKIYPLIP